MFIVDNGRAKQNLDAVLGELKDLIARAGGELVNIDRWDERKLAYEIKKQRRGTYVLSHWYGPADAPAKAERQCGLSETVLRVLTVQDEDGTRIAKSRQESGSKR
jgi:small subunit ribosomal protein S6